MRKILDKLGLNEKKYGWYDLDPEIQNGFFLKFGASLLILIIGIILWIYTKDLSIGIPVILLSIIYFCTVLYNLSIFYYAKFHMIKGFCSEVERKSISIFKKSVYGNCKMYVKSGRNYYEVPIPYNSKYKNGNYVAIYCIEENIYQLNGDMYKINNPLAISIIKQK